MSNKAEPIPATIDKAPDPKVLIDRITEAMADATAFVDQMDLAGDTRLCRWPGQSDDGRKYARNLDKAPFPWEGASDTRVRLADGLVNENVKLLKQAWFRSQVQAHGRDLGDLARSSRATTLLKWVFKTQMADDIRDEIEFLAQWREMYGAAVLGVHWLSRKVGRVATLSVEQLIDAAIAAGIESGAQAGASEEQMEEIAAESVERVRDLILNERNESEALGYLRGVDPGITPTVAKRVLRQLREGGVATYPRAEIGENRPQWQALLPFQDVFFPVEVCHLQEAPWVARAEWLHEAELDARAGAEGWDAAWVREVKKHKGKSGLPDTQVEFARGRVSQADEEERRDLIQVVHVWYQAESGADCPAVYRTCIHGEVPKRSGYHALTPYEHGKMPFVAFRRERPARRILESRGIPEIVRTWQSEIKTQRDSRADRTSIETLPPLIVPGARGGMRFNLGPGQQIPLRSQEVLKWLDPPRGGGGSMEYESAVQADCDRYFGRMAQNVPAELRLLHEQDLIDDWLNDLRQAAGQTFQLCQQYLDEPLALRVAGGAEPVLVGEDDIRGMYDLSVEFDARDLDTEFVAKKAELIGQIVVPLDTEGVIDRARLVHLVMRSIDPMAAEAILVDLEGANAREAEDEMAKLSQMATGVEPIMREQGENHALRLQVLQGAIEKSPRLQEQLQSDEIFQQMVQARMQHHQMQVQQEENKQIGRLGARPVLG